MGAFEFPDSLDEFGKLLEYIPIVSDIPSNGKFMEGATIDSRFPVGKEGHTNKTGESRDTISFRDIVRLFSRFLATNIRRDGRGGNWEQLIHEQRYKQLLELGYTYPVNYLLFDFCLAALDGDLVDARLYLAHSLHMLGLNSSLNLLLSIIVNERLTEDGDARYLLALLCKATEPRSARTYLETFGPDFRRRYDAYVRELKRVE